HLRTPTFQDLGLLPETSDSVVWQRCQQEELVLLTANLNSKGPDSLEATIRALNTPASLPVFTVATADRVLQSRDYAERVADRILEYLFDRDDFRGTGRLFLP